MTDSRPCRYLLALCLLAGLIAPADAYYKTITVTGYYAIAADGDAIWGGSSGNSEGWSGKPQETWIWRYTPADGRCRKWTLKELVGMKGVAAFFVPLPDQVLVGISGSDMNVWYRDKGATLAEGYAGIPKRATDGGLIRYDRATAQWSVLDLPLYDLQNYQLVGDDLWLTCGDHCNPRKARIARYNLRSGKLDLAETQSDTHCIAVAPALDRAYSGTHHGRGLEVTELSTLKMVGHVDNAKAAVVASQSIDADSEPLSASTWKETSCSLIKAAVKIDDQLWVAEPQVITWNKWFGGLHCYHLPDLQCVWGDPGLQQYTDLGDETAQDLQLDPTDSAILWASNAKGLFKAHRLESPPRVEMPSMDQLPDHNLQHIAVDRQYLWAGTEQGYLYRYDKAGGVWAVCGRWQDGLAAPSPLALRRQPGVVRSLRAVATAGQVKLTWDQPAPPARSYYISRNGILVGTCAGTEWSDATAPDGNLAYSVVAGEGAYLKGGLLGEPAKVAVTLTGGAAAAPPTEARPAKAAYGLGTMIYVKAQDLYVDEFPFPNIAGEYPMTCVTWPQAKALAAMAGERLPTNAEYLALLATGWQEKNATGNAEIFWGYDHYNSRTFERNGALKNVRLGGIQDLGSNIKEWLADRSPLADGQTYGLAAGGAYPQVAFPVRSYFPSAELPPDSWARDIARYNHSEVGFRCVLSGAELAAALRRKD